ncbi:MAG: hypothetical protein JSS38_17635 [Nitrospira sp.]|nr:hypothetical protein [Nitrospira sp.]
MYLGWRGALVKEYPNSPRVPFTESWTLSDVVLGLPAVLSFWGRKETAMDVALGSTREFLARLGHIQAEVNSMNAKARIIGRDRKWHDACQELAQNENSTCIAMRTLFIGHSFGSLTIYNALAESLIASIAVSPHNALHGDEVVSSPYADLIVLINPALEGKRFEPLYQASLARMKRSPYLPTQPPMLVVVTSTSDYATRFAFPLSRFFSTLFQSNSLKNKDGTEIAGRAEEEINANRNTVGHIPRYMTHYLDSFLPTPDIEQKRDTDDTCLTSDWERLTRFGLPNGRSLTAALDDNKLVWKQKLQASKATKQGWPARAFCGGIRLSPAMQEAKEGTDPLADLPDRSSDQNPWNNQLLSQDIANEKWGSGLRSPHNPIWVVRTKDTRIINGHNGVFTPSMTGFLQQLYRDVLR